MNVLTEKNEETTSLRFGGISPVVLRELSGVYQPFVKAVKEIISNAYDADSNKVHLDFTGNFSELTILDDGFGMDPIEFVRDYIRIGKSFRKEEFTAIKKRPRIGGKGIGFLAPARYCEEIEVTTKKKVISEDKIIVETKGITKFDVSNLLLRGLVSHELLKKITIVKVTHENGEEIPSAIDGFQIQFNDKVDVCEIWYQFDARDIQIVANINFDALFTLESSKSLEDIDNFCNITIRNVPDEIDISFTKITLKRIKEFVRSDLLNPGKRRARNVESFEGKEQFLWNLSRIIPIKAHLHENLPNELKDFIKSNIDGEENDYPLLITHSIDGGLTEELKRKIVEPERQLDINEDGDIVKILDYEFDDFKASGFLVGQSSTIFPAESRGILLRVKGVAVGEPTFFGLDQLFTGSSKVALSQISGEINIFKGIDAIQDINPGRDGFYKESRQYNRLKNLLVGDNPEKLVGPLKDVINGIITRSEINASMTNFIKRHESQRKAILEAGSGIAELSFEDPTLVDHFFLQKDDYELQLSPAIPFKAEGKLASYTVSVENGLNEDYKIDYTSKKLVLSSNADIWKKNIYIGGTDFEIIQKQGKQKKIFCEVNSNIRKIYLNWEHPMRGTMGDGNYIKHCLATVASALPQDQLNIYIQLVTNKI